MTSDDIKILSELKRDAPYSWRCSSTYYVIAAKYGVSIEASDVTRDKLIDEALNVTNPTTR